eukprot:CAMPEP_0175694102 /NCGR_PEP_ID=MMETSP0097-20121207/31763_1 /TAXON_ID=311494 /ORGANISM="Alexandrium monilatum, Strain CCMP3105" /LENGTH=49 /DNA_ID= /DNA_START= /DNA_END= /DNA_ORIENTATION=
MPCEQLLRATPPGVRARSARPQARAWPRLRARARLPAPALARACILGGG